MKKRKLFPVFALSCTLFGSTFGMRRELSQQFQESGNQQKGDDNSRSLLAQLLKEEKKRHGKLKKTEEILIALNKMLKQRIEVEKNYNKEIRAIIKKKRTTQMVDTNMLCTFAVFISALMLSLLF